MMNQSKAVGSVWYVAAVLPLVIGAGLAVSKVAGAIDSVEQMQRVVVPGAGEVTLAAGEYSVYGERRSTFQGTAYVVDALSVRCGVLDADGKPLELTTPSGSERYQIGGYAGDKLFHLVVPHDGKFQVTCESTGEQARTTIAIGTSAVWPMFVGIALGVLGFFVAGGAFTLVFVLRRRAYLRARAAAAGLPMM
jgi:hypothetical protein